MKTPTHVALTPEIARSVDGQSWLLPLPSLLSLRYCSFSARDTDLLLGSLTTPLCDPGKGCSAWVCPYSLASLYLPIPRGTRRSSWKSRRDAENWPGAAPQLGSHHCQHPQPAGSVCTVTSPTEERSQWYLGPVTTRLNSVLPLPSSDQPVLNLTCHVGEETCAKSLLVFSECPFFCDGLFTYREHTVQAQRANFLP